MRLWRRKDFIRQAIHWKLEREAVLSAEVQILETLLKTARQELADMRELKGEKLALIYASLSSQEMQDGMGESRAFAAVLETIWLAGQHNLKNKGATA